MLDTVQLQETGKVLRTGVWSGDRPLELDFPAGWDLTVHWPRTPAVLAERDMREILERPWGQPPIREMCRGKSRPLVIVDDLNRPTPVGCVLPLLLEHFREAGIPPGNVRILLATGTHGAPRADLVREKVGAAASACRLLVHDCHHNLVPAGRTSFGTPVAVNVEVMSSDIVIGIGGIYPNQTAGFGGGSKLALGVLGFRSILHLHYRHPSLGWGRYDPTSEFRRDLDEIARMIRLDTMISLQINADRQIIRLACGDHQRYFSEEVAFCRKIFGAPPPADADVVIANAWPGDLSLTVVHQKGITPLSRCPDNASRIVIASYPEGAGYHGLAPVVGRPRFYRLRRIARRVSVMPPRDLAAAALRRFSRQWRGKRAGPKRPIWLYRPGQDPAGPSCSLAGFRVAPSWPELLRAIETEQGDKESLKVTLYPCAPLQVLG